MRNRLLLIVGLVLLSLNAKAEPITGSLEQIIDGMEQNGLFHETKYGKTDKKTTHPGPSRSSRPVSQSGASSATTGAARNAEANSRDDAAPADPEVASNEEIEPPPEPTIVYPNALAEQPAASGGLEQILNGMELNGSSGLPPSTGDGTAYAADARQNRGMSERLK